MVHAPHLEKGPSPMSKMIFISLPVADVERSRRFYEALGFTHNPQFSDDNGACMVWSEAIYVMVMSKTKWAEFTDRPICPQGSSEVALNIAVDSRDAVDAFAEAAGANGGTVDVNPPQDHGFMYGRDVLDPDGHVWGPMWMDPAAAQGEPAAACA